jgi:saccharopine dehydrogenase-like NADP-dependent oxidoreductase
MKIALLGAGHIGQSIARLLVDSGDYEIYVADRDALALQKMSGLGVFAEVIDFNDQDALYRFLGKAEVTVNALPYYMATAVATAAVSAKVHYFDLTEDVQATKVIADLAATADTAFMPQCGLAPGFIGIAANHLSKGFDEIHEIKMRVGALPEFPTNTLKYNLTWSVDGLVNEYCHPCEAIRNGVRMEIQALEGKEHFSLDGVEYEAFNTSGGLGTLCQTLQGKVRNLDYKSVRYPGHLALARFLLEEMRLGDDQELLKKILRNAVPTTMQDVVLVFVTVTGMCNGDNVQKVFTRKIFASHSGDVHESAIQITTAAGICTAVDLFREGKLPQRGFIRQELIALPDFLANRFGRVYNQTTRRH